MGLPNNLIGILPAVRHKNTNIRKADTTLTLRRANVFWRTVEKNALCEFLARHNSWPAKMSGRAMFSIEGYFQAPIRRRYLNKLQPWFWSLGNCRSDTAPLPSAVWSPGTCRHSLFFIGVWSPSPSSFRRPDLLQSFKEEPPLIRLRASKHIDPYVSNVFHLLTDYLGNFLYEFCFDDRKKLLTDRFLQQVATAKRGKEGFKLFPLVITGLFP